MAERFDVWQRDGPSIVITEHAHCDTRIIREVIGYLYDGLRHSCVGLDVVLQWRNSTVADTFRGQDTVGPRLPNIAINHQHHDITARLAQLCHKCACRLWC